MKVDFYLQNRLELWFFALLQSQEAIRLCVLSQVCVCYSAGNCSVYNDACISSIFIVTYPAAGHRLTAT